MSDLLLKFEKVNKHYRAYKEDLHVLKDLDFDVHRGDFVSILGKSGSGKSTLLNLMGLLDKADSGNIYYSDKNIKKIKEREKNLLRNEFLGFIFQFHYLLPEFNAIENVMIPALAKKNVDVKDVEKRAKELLEEMELFDRSNHKPNELSGGEKQRVAIARALINNPKIVLADEPTGNLDDETSESIHNLLKRINKEKNQTIIVVTHSTELSNITEKKLFLKKGRLVESL